MANENRLTKRDKVVYSAIAEFIKENKYPPSVRELCELTDRTSTATISATLRSLERKGYITTKKGANRTIRIMKDLEGNPIADAVEVVHGRWAIIEGDALWDRTAMFQCSACGVSQTTLFGRSNYCPNCGADMRERKDNE